METTTTESATLVERSEVTGRGPILVVVEVAVAPNESSDEWEVIVVHHYPVDRVGATEYWVEHRLGVDDAGLVDTIKAAQVLARRDREAYRQSGRWVAD